MREIFWLRINYSNSWIFHIQIDDFFPVYAIILFRKKAEYYAIVINIRYVGLSPALTNVKLNSNGITFIFLKKQKFTCKQKMFITNETLIKSKQAITNKLPRQYRECLSNIIYILSNKITIKTILFFAFHLLKIWKETSELINWVFFWEVKM